MTDYFATIPAIIPELRRFTCAMGFDAQTSDDIVETAIVRYLENPSRPSGEKQLQIDLLSHVYIVCRMKKDREVSVSASAINFERFDGEIEKRLSTLPFHGRAFWVLTCLESLDYATVADIMELTESSIRSHLHQAHERIRLTVLGPGGMTDNDGGLHG